MNKKLVVSVLLTIIYAVITLIAVLHHEIWADEAQVWQLCKYLSLPELFNHLHNEGHPSFFYLLVMPFAKLTSNIIYMQLICWFAMCIAVFLLIYKAPFPNIVKFAIITSAGFFYFLPVMARNYAIIPVLVFLAAILYSKQKEHPVLYALIIALIANTHAIMLGFSGIMLLVFLYDNFKELKNKKIIISIALMLLGIIACVLQLYDTAGSNIYITFNTTHLLSKIVYTFLNFFAYSFLYGIKQGNNVIPLFAKIMISILALCFIYIHWVLLRNSKKLFIISICSFLFQMFIYIFLYGASDTIYVTRIFSYYIILIFCLWLYMNTAENTKKLTVAVSVFFLLTIFNGISFYIKDIRYNYSGAKETAEYIKENINRNNSILLTDHEAICISLAYYLNDEYILHSAMRNSPIKYVIWDEYVFSGLTPEQWKKYLAMAILPNEIKNYDIYIIKSKYQESITTPIDHDNENLQKIFSSQNTIKKYESYNIYKYVKNKNE